MSAIRMLLLMACGVATLGGAVFAQESVEERLEKLESENRRMSNELEASRSALDRLESKRSADIDAEVEDYLSYTEGAQGEATSALQTKKRAFLTFYGFLRLDLYFNTGRMNDVITPFFVEPETGNRNDDEFGMDVRLTRVGMIFNFGEVGDMDATGRLEIDFSNTPSSGEQSRETPRIRLAYFTLEAAKWWLRAGQDWDVISPLIPSINTETAMWKAGNTGDRRPMVRWYYKGSRPDPGEGSVTVDVAIGLTGAIDGVDLDGDGAVDGFDSGLPNVQVRVAWEHRSVEESLQEHAGHGHHPSEVLVVGAWAMISRLETSTPVGGESNWTPWIAGLDFSYTVGKLLLRAEVWYAEGGADMRANTGQTLDSATGDLVKGPGGWMETSFRPNEGWQFYAGGTIDSPENDSVPDGANPTRNWTGYVGVRRHWTKRLRTTFDVIYWETSYKDGTLGNTVRFNLWTSFDF